MPTYGNFLLVPVDIQKNSLIAGIDEAGRGPLAGPVTASAVVLPISYENPSIIDSKQLSEKKRCLLFDEIRSVALAYAVVSVGPRRIEQLNIREATRQAMRLCAMRICRQLQSADICFLVDGNMPLGSGFESEAIVKGDEKVTSIAAASILAKVTRDGLMGKLHERYPVYEFVGHKGYPTKKHRDLIRDFGPCPMHRRTFAGVIEFVK